MQSYRGSPGRPPNNGHAPGRKLIQVWISAELKRRLDRAAYDANTPAAELVAVAIERELARRQEEERR